MVFGGNRESNRGAAIGRPRLDSCAGLESGVSRGKEEDKWLGGRSPESEMTR